MRIILWIGILLLRNWSLWIFWYHNPWLVLHLLILCIVEWKGLAKTRHVNNGLVNREREIQGSKKQRFVIQRFKRKLWLQTRFKLSYELWYYIFFDAHLVTYSTFDFMSVIYRVILTNLNIFLRSEYYTETNLPQFFFLSFDWRKKCKCQLIRNKCNQAELL